MAQRAHDLVEQALAGLGLQIVRGAVLGGIRLDCRAHARQTVLDVLLLPVERVDLQLHIPLRIDFAGALFQPRDAFRIGIDDHKHRPTVVRRDTARQLFDRPPQHFDGDLRHFRRRVLVAIRREQRQQEIRQQQRHHDHAGGYKDQFVAHREVRAGRQRVGDREHQRQRDGALRSAECHDRGGTPALRRHFAPLAGGGVAREPEHQRDPQEPHGDHHGGDGEDRAHQQAVADVRIIPAGRHRVRQQHAEQDEHCAVERERQHAPHA